MCALITVWQCYSIAQLEPGTVGAEHILNVFKIFLPFLIFHLGMFVVDKLVDMVSKDHNSAPSFEAQVVSRYFNERVVWSHSYSCAQTATWIVKYMAWKYDHFSSIPAACGIYYSVKEIA